VKRHIDELAELYALGSLEAAERAVVERHVRGCIACADRIRAAEQTIAFISDLEAHHEPPHAIAENFAARLAVSRHAQKRLSLKVITTVFVGGLIVIGLVH
jgi:anti-sigma-K factor RskA